ncbi:MAG: sugar transferase [Actinomycetota bacterium]|nr:sugar transferase [Actinomycetota bacterium]
MAIPSDDCSVAPSELQSLNRSQAPSRPSWQMWVAGLLVLVDVSAVLLSCLISYLVRGKVYNFDLFGASVPTQSLVAIAVPTWLLAHAVSGSYDLDFSNAGLNAYRAPVVVGIRSMAAVCILSFALQTKLSRLLVVVYFPTLIALSVGGRFAVRRGLGAVRRRGRAQVRMILVGDRLKVGRFAGHLYRDQARGYEVIGVCLPEPETHFSFRGRNIPVLGTPDDVVAAARSADVGAVAVADSGQFEQLTLQRLAWALERSGIDLLVAPDVADMAGPRIRVAPVTGLPLLHITEPRVDGLTRRLTSHLSQVAAVPLLVALSPVLLIVALAIKVADGGPVFYRQERIGYRRQPFHILKFRTMSTDADRRLPQIIHLNEHDGALFKMKNDPRITPVGRWLRKFSIDELPQLINVARGDMVFVGPRPVLERETTNFGEAEHRRFKMKPGITGLWQVSGRSSIPWEEAVKLDLYYVENWSPLLDVLILVRTLWVVLAGGGM